MKINSKVLLAAGSPLIFLMVACGLLLNTEIKNASALDFSLSINFRKPWVICAGEPVIVRLQLGLKPEMGVKTKIKVPSDKIQIEVKNEQGKIQKWPLHLAPSFLSLRTIEVDADKEEELVWILSPEQSRKISKGAYTLTAVLKGVTGLPESDIQVKVVDAVEASQSQNKKSELEINYQMLLGEKEKALAAVDSWVKRDPVAGNEVKGDLLLEKGDKQKAMQAYRIALETFDKKNPNAVEPLAVLEYKYQELLYGSVREELKRTPPKKMNEDELKKKESQIAQESLTPKLSSPQTLPREEALQGPAGSNSVTKAVAEPIQPSFVDEKLSELVSPLEIEKENGEGELPAIHGDLKVVLKWEDPVDVDLRVWNQEGEKIRITEEADRGPASESFVVRSEDQGSVEKYFVAVALIGARGSKARVTILISVPGKPDIQRAANLIYDGTHQMWIVASIDGKSLDVNEINAFEPIANYLKK